MLTPKTWSSAPASFKKSATNFISKNKCSMRKWTPWSPKACRHREYPSTCRIRIDSWMSNWGSRAWVQDPKCRLLFRASISRSQLVVSISGDERAATLVKGRGAQELPLKRRHGRQAPYSIRKSRQSRRWLNKRRTRVPEAKSIPNYWLIAPDSYSRSAWNSDERRKNCKRSWSS